MYRAEKTNKNKLTKNASRKQLSCREEWRENGKLHRIGNPAVVEADGTLEWWLNGERHRLDGPAIEHTKGSKHWWKNEKRHRLDGPAIEEADGHQEWWIEGERHRLDGPAVERADGYQEWWVNGVYLEGLDLEDYLEASNQSLPSVLSELSRHKNRVIAQSAAHNPNCPLEAQIEWALTRREGSCWEDER